MAPPCLGRCAACGCSRKWACLTSSSRKPRGPKTCRARNICGLTQMRGFPASRRIGGDLGIDGHQSLPGAKVRRPAAYHEAGGARRRGAMELLGDVGDGSSVALLQKPLRVLDDALSARGYLAADDFTVADLNVASILAWGKMSRLDLSGFSHVAKWLDASLRRPAYGRVRGGAN
jgi:Glutathione S-transferase, C-terminal domain